MTSSVLVSIIIPTYNRSQVLKDAVESILSQTYKNFEIIVISDGSTDDTTQVIKQFDKDDRVHFIQLSRNTGLPAKVRNTGLKMAKGEFIAFCDDDDLWYDKKLELQINQMNARKADISSTAVTFFDEKGITVPDRGNKFRMAMAQVCSLGFNPSVFFTNFLVNSSVVLRKELLDKIGLLNESKELRATEDYEFWLRIIGQGYRYIFIKESLVKYRIHPSQITTNDTKAAWFRSAIALRSLKEIQNGIFLRLAIIYANFRIKRLS